MRSKVTQQKETNKGLKVQCIDNYVGLDYCKSPCRLFVHCILPAVSLYSCVLAGECAGPVAIANLHIL